MASLFVSHSSHDAAETAELVGWLRVEGFDALFVDFDPDVGIPAGRNWERELYSQLRRADGVLYVASPASNASRWCAIEVGIARSIGKPIFPVLVSGTERLPLLADVQWVDLTSDGEGAHQRLLAGLRRFGLDPVDAFAWDSARSPYPGLEPFGTEDAAVFFGRDAEVDRLLELLQPTVQHAAGRCVGIVGCCPGSSASPIGGLSSPRFVPGQDPLKSLAGSLASALRGPRPVALLSGPGRAVRARGREARRAGRRASRDRLGHAEGAGGDRPGRGARHPHRASRPAALPRPPHGRAEREQPGLGGGHAALGSS